MWRILQLILVFSVSLRCEATKTADGVLSVLNLLRDPEGSSYFNILKSEFSSPNTLLKAYKLVIELANVVSPDPYPLHTLPSTEHLENM